MFYGWESYIELVMKKVFFGIQIGSPNINMATKIDPNDVEKYMLYGS